MQLALTIRHHDHAYVEQRGGWQLLTHLMGAQERVEYRRQAIQRGWARFDTAEAGGRPEPEVGGLGLMVLQRALFAAEDLGGLLHGLGGNEPWTRLRTATIRDIDAAFERAITYPNATFASVFRLATDDQIDAENLSSDVREALGRLRPRVVARWQRMLTGTASLWLGYRSVAKATMHAYPILAGDYVFGTPGAGKISHGLSESARGRAAVVIASRRNGSEVMTDRQVVRLDREAVARYRADGRVAARLYGEVCDVQASSTMSGHGATLPLGLVTTSDDDRLLLDATVAARQP